MLTIEGFANTGELFDGHYALIRPLSVDGATADVWLALDTNTVTEEVQLSDVVRLNDGEIEKLGLMVAIKIYRPQNALDIEGEQRFRDEYMIVFNCHHTNLIHPTHYSIYKEIPYLVLPYCKKGSSELLVGNLTKEQDIWKYIYDVASGLSYLHNSCKPPIIHQDIKPANVLLDDYGNYAITDFGISVKHDDSQGYFDEEDNSGTFAYMAPERFNLDAEPSSESDIWAFGATLCELITGKVPFGENGGEAQINGVIMTALPKDLPRAIKNLINRCLNQYANKRPTAKQLADEASEHLSGNIKKYNYLILGIIILGTLTAFFFWSNNSIALIKLLGEDNPPPPKGDTFIVESEQKLVHPNGNDTTALLLMDEARHLAAEGDAHRKNHPIGYDAYDESIDNVENYYIMALDKCNEAVSMGNMLEAKIRHQAEALYKDICDSAIVVVNRLKLMAVDLDMQKPRERAEVLESHIKQ